MRFPWYVTIPALAVVAGLLPSIVLLAIALQVGIAKAEPLPYAASARIDGDKQARQVLDAEGFALTLAIDGTTLTASMRGARLPESARLECYRPDDPAADRAVAWTDPRKPLSVPLGRPGSWRVRLVGTVDGRTARLSEERIRAGG